MNEIIIFLTIVVSIIAIVGFGAIGFAWGLARGKVIGIESLASGQLVEVISMLSERDRQTARLEAAEAAGDLRTVEHDPPIRVFHEPVADRENAPPSRQPIDPIVPQSPFGRGGAFVDNHSVNIPNTSF